MPKSKDPIKAEQNKLQHGIRMRELWKDPNSMYNQKEFRVKRGDSVRGEKNPCYGRIRPEEERKRISESKKGKVLSQEVYEKIAQKHRGRKNTLATKQKMSEIS